MTNIPIAILGSKIDKPGAASEQELRTALGLHQITTDQEASKSEQIREVVLFRVSFVRQMGYSDGLKWLCGRMKCTLQICEKLIEACVMSRYLTSFASN